MNSKEIRIVALLILDSVFFLLEAIIGYTVHSLALIADSFHMLNDIISLIIALWAVRVKNTKPADGKYTYGWQRAEILGALINAVFLLALCFTIIMDSIQRFFEPQEISNPKLILIVGIAGLISNGVGLVLFHEHGHSHSHGTNHSGDSNSNSNSTSHSHSHGEVATTFTQGDEEEHIGTGSGDENEHTPLLYNITHTTMKSTPSEVFDYLPDNVVERYSNYQSSFVGQQQQQQQQQEQTPTNIENGQSLLNGNSTTTNYSASASSSSDNTNNTNNTMVNNTSEPTRNKSQSKLQKFKQKSMNMEGVFLHVLGDALGNIGVIITALIIWKTNYSWRFLSDPITSLFITLIILNSALPLVGKALRILLQSAPPYIDSNLIVNQIKQLPLIKNIHDFHVWNLNEDILIASLHIELNPNCEVNLPLKNGSSDNNNNNNNNNNSNNDNNNNIQTDSPSESIVENDQDLEIPSQIDRKLFLAAVSQVREVLHIYGINSVTIQPEFLNSKKICRLIF